MTPTQAFLARPFRVLGTARIAVLALAACGNSALSPATVLMRNTRGNNANGYRRFLRLAGGFAGLLLADNAHLARPIGIAITH